jgi:putative transposase
MVAAYPKRVARAQKMGWKIPVFTPVKCPQSEQCAIRYHMHTSTLDWTQQTVCLSNSAGKTTIPFRIPHFSQKDVGHPIATADLCSRNGRWWLHVVVDVPEPALQKQERVVRFALRSLPHGTFLATHSGRNVTVVSFASNAYRNPLACKSTKRHLKTLGRQQAGRQQARFHRDPDHVLSKRIVHSTPAGATIVFENLANIRETSKMGRGKANKNVWNKRKLHSWTFAHLFAFTAYKAQERGMHIECID